MNRSLVICTAMLSVAIVTTAVAVLFSGRYSFHVQPSSPLVYRFDRITGAVDAVTLKGEVRMGTPAAAPGNGAQASSIKAPALPTAPLPGKAHEELDALDRRFGITPSKP